MSEPEKMILAAEAAKRLHVTTRTVQRWVKKEYFPGARKKSPTLSGAYLIPESALLAYVSFTGLLQCFIDFSG